MTDPDAPGPRRRWQEEIGPFLTLGIQLAIAVVVFFFLGKWLDGKFGTEPWLAIGGLVVGVAGSMIKFIRTALQLGREADAAAKEAGGDHGHAEHR